MKRLSREPYRIVYPHYLDSKRSRQAGRRVRRSAAIPLPREAELRAAAESLKLRFEIQADKSYPRDSNKAQYRIIVFTSEPKPKIIERLAKKLGEMRGQSKQA